MTIDAKAILGEVQANHKRLNACPMHDFAVVPLEPGGVTPRPPFRHRYRCARCAGEIDAVAYFWYSAGRRHGSA